MKRYLLFVYDNYYPSGGTQDLQGDFDTIPECEEKRMAEELKSYSNAHILDIQTGEVIYLD